ncbi:hypothetical protein F4823DRAFT_608495 [Ustulina deusta]|nr:hypothetical protein F4823DRAFT_608495 [Ustulina deusta]
MWETLSLLVRCASLLVLQSPSILSWFSVASREWQYKRLRRTILRCRSAGGTAYNRTVLSHLACNKAVCDGICAN